MITPVWAGASGNHTDNASRQAAIVVDISALPYWPQYHLQHNEST